MISTVFKCDISYSYLDVLRFLNDRTDVEILGITSDNKGRFFVFYKVIAITPPY